MTAPRSPLWPGVPLALASAALFGASAPLSKLLIGAVDPWLLAGLLYLGAGLGLALVHGARAALGLGGVEAPLRRGDVPWLAAVILFGGILGPLLLMLGLARTSAASGSLLLNVEGVATLGLAWLVFRENVDRRLLLGAAAILVGGAVLSWGGEGARLDVGAGTTDEEGDELYRQLIATEDALAATPATCMADLAAKALVLASIADDRGERTNHCPALREEMEAAVEAGLS